MDRAERHGFVQIGLSVRPLVGKRLDALVEETGWTKAQTVDIALRYLERCPDKEALLHPTVDELLGSPR